MPQTKAHPLSPPCEGGDKGVVRLKVSNVPIRKEGHRGTKNFPKETIYMVNPHEPKAHEKTGKISPSLNPSHRGRESSLAPCGRGSG